MFFLMGISDQRREIDFSQMIICDQCGAYGRYQLFMICTVLSLFFIPCFKWNRRYYVQTSCCGSIYELDREIGARIAAGEKLEIRPEHLRLMQSRGGAGKRCAGCGYAADADFDFCPKCGKKL